MPEDNSGIFIFTLDISSCFTYIYITNLIEGKTMTNSMNFLYENITNKILALLEKGASPWKKNWSTKDFPMNLTTKIPYHGINVFMLLSSPYALTPFWLTWSQVMKLKGKVKEAEAKNYETVIFWKQLKFKNADDEEKSFPMVRYTRVYNLGQCELDAETLKKLVPETEAKEFNHIEACENIVKGYKDCPDINHGGDRAYYSPLMDKIQMPLHESFSKEDNYYTTLFHEMGHSTGSEKRLKRFKANDTGMFGSETYSKEELVAEMCASFLSAEAGIENNTIENSAAYIKGWLKAIKNADRTFVVSAASKANYAVNYILGRLQSKTN